MKMKKRSKNETNVFRREITDIDISVERCWWTVCHKDQRSCVCAFTQQFTSLVQQMNLAFNEERKRLLVCSWSASSSFESFLEVTAVESIIYAYCMCRYFLVRVKHWFSLWSLKSPTISVLFIGAKDSSSLDFRVKMSHVFLTLRDPLDQHMVGMCPFRTLRKLYFISGLLFVANLV